MTYGLSKLKVEKLVKQVENRYGDGCFGAPIQGLTASESGFFRHAVNSRGATAYRAGWPDFLLDDPKLGWIGVEVKGGNDIIRPTQAKMFAALESVGLRILVWHDQTPDKLIPWRKFGEMKNLKVVREKHQHPRFRTQIQGMMIDPPSRKTRPPQDTLTADTDDELDESTGV